MNIVAFDGAATPVSHTFIPIAVSREKDMVKAEWREASASVPTEACNSVVMTLTKLKSGVWRSETRVTVPVMESVSGQNASGYTAAPKVAFEDTYAVIGYHHPRSTITSRRLARMLAVNIANNVTSSVAAATAGPLPELTDFLIAPT